MHTNKILRSLLQVHMNVCRGEPCFFEHSKVFFCKKSDEKKNDEIQPSAQNASKEPTRYVPLPLNKQFLVFFPFVLN